MDAHCVCYMLVETDAVLVQTEGMQVLTAWSPANESWDLLPAESPKCTSRDVLGCKGLSIQLGTKPKKGRMHVKPSSVLTS